MTNEVEVTDEMRTEFNNKVIDLADEVSLNLEGTNPAVLVVGLMSVIGDAIKDVAMRDAEAAKILYADVQDMTNLMEGYINGQSHLPH